MKILPTALMHIVLFTVDRLAAAIAKGMQSPEVKARVATDGSEAVGSTPREFDRFLRSELARFARVIKAAGIRTE